MYQPGMVLNPGGPASLKWSTSSAPLCNLQNSSQRIDLDLGTTQPEGNFTLFLQLQLITEIYQNVYGKKCIKR
ncbi:MAG: hypothetical protein MJE68_20675, partial [Proteobacteria bacterium]|nr:hypothetical protein [Pseudomonadota bacterium]